MVQAVVWNHRQTLLVFLLDDMMTFLLTLSTVSSYRMPNLPTRPCWHVLVPNLLASSPQSSGTTISNTLLSNSILSLWSLLVVVVRLGEELI